MLVCLEGLWVAGADGGIAQLVERLLCKQEVIGSTPFASTIPGTGIPGTGILVLALWNGFSSFADIEIP